MEHSDELTFADYFNAEKEIYRNITCAALAARWLLDHGFVMPNGWTANNSGPPADCDVLLDMTGSFFVPKTTSQSEFMEVNVWNFSIAQLILCRLS